MKRQAIDNGGWFDTESAKEFSEGKRFDGRNTISLATGSQWEHEALYRTRKGTYVINLWSDWQGSHEVWRKVDVEEATAWLIRNGYELTTVAETNVAQATEQ